MKRIVVEPSDVKDGLILVGVEIEASHDLRVCLPKLTWPETMQLRDALTRFLSDARNMERPET